LAAAGSRSSMTHPKKRRSHSITEKWRPRLKAYRPIARSSKGRR
jgi:hypothetical protein